MRFRVIVLVDPSVAGGAKVGNLSWTRANRRINSSSRRGKLPTVRMPLHPYYHYLASMNFLYYFRVYVC